MMIDSNALAGQIKKQTDYAEGLGRPLDRFTLQTVARAISFVEDDQRTLNQIAGMKRKYSRAQALRDKERRLWDSAWNKGWRSGEAGRPASACPYKQELCAKAWRDGHTRAYSTYHGGPAQ